MWDPFFNFKNYDPTVNPSSPYNINLKLKKEILREKKGKKNVHKNVNASISVTLGEPSGGVSKRNMTQKHHCTTHSYENVQHTGSTATQTLTAVPAQSWRAGEERSVSQDVQSRVVNTQRSAATPLRKSTTLKKRGAADLDTHMGGG